MLSLYTTDIMCEVSIMWESNELPSLIDTRVLHIGSASFDHVAIDHSQLYRPMPRVTSNDWPIRESYFELANWRRGQSDVTLTYCIFVHPIIYKPIVINHQHILSLIVYI